MKVTPITRKLLLAALIIVPLTASAAIVSRVTSFSDGDVLFASELNDEFNNLVNGVNNISDDNITDAAAIDPKKISSTIAGSGLSRNSTTGVLSVSPDDVSIEVVSNDVQLKDGGTSRAKLASGVATSVIGRSANSTGVVADIAASTNGTVLKRESDALVFDTVDTADITNGAVTRAKQASLGQQVSSAQTAFSTSSTSYVAVTNLSVTITTSGRPVYLGLISTAASDESVVFCSTANSVTPGCSLAFYKDGTAVSKHVFGGRGDLADNDPTPAQFAPLGSFNHIDVTSAGTYTYTVRVRGAYSLNTISGTGFGVTLENVRLVAYEL